MAKNGDSMYRVAFTTRLREQIKGPRMKKEDSLSLGLATPKAETQSSSESLAITRTHNLLVELKQ